MSVRRAALPLALVLVVAQAPAALADKLDKDSKKWLDDVAALILPEEEKTFKGLKEKSDREEFQKIFWARRNPLGAAATENPYRPEFEKAKAEADQRFRAAGQAGSGTDCGRVFILLGEPNEAKKDPGGSVAGGRIPEIWTYKSRPGFSFKGGQIDVPFDSQCRLPEGSPFGEQVAKARIVDPNIDYRVGKDGRLTKLADMLPKPTPVQALLKEPKEDFPLVAQTKLVMSGKDGATYVAGIVRADAGVLSVQDEGGAKRAAIVVAAQALDEGGKVAASTSDRESTADVVNGAVLASYGFSLKPGKYSVRVALHDPKAGKGSVATVPLEVPDFASGELAISDLIVVSDVQEHPAQDPKSPLAAFYLGKNLLLPRFGNGFAKTDALQVLGFIYNAQTDPATGKASVVARFAIQKDGKTLTSSEDQAFEEPAAAPGIGPVPLEKFQPGKYVIQLKVQDKVAKKDLVKEGSFEVLP
ncbi:MAG: GWxTD domain-containing protein [Acidobacteria bacterium]|nr:GWxTD domain-containing protein [Acidobacteriota bacterium]